MSVATDRCCFFASGVFHLIFGSVPNRWLAPMMTYGWFGCDDLTHRFSPLLGQSHQRRVLRYHTLDRLHDCLEPHGIEVWIEVLNHSMAGCPCIRRFRSSNGWVSAGAILRRHPSRAHHSDAVSLDGKVLGDAAPDLWVVFGGILIGGY
jgi:hypothetical protein